MVKYLRKRFVALSPKAKQVIIGAGLAYDPIPAPRYKTFECSDAAAINSDWTAVAGDMWQAIGRAERYKKQRVGK